MRQMGIELAKIRSIKNRRPGARLATNFVGGLQRNRGETRIANDNSGRKLRARELIVKRRRLCAFCTRDVCLPDDGKTRKREIMKSYSPNMYSLYCYDAYQRAAL